MNDAVDFVSKLVGRIAVIVPSASLFNWISAAMDRESLLDLFGSFWRVFVMNLKKYFFIYSNATCKSS